MRPSARTLRKWRKAALERKELLKTIENHELTEDVRADTDRILTLTQILLDQALMEDKNASTKKAT